MKSFKGLLIAALTLFCVSSHAFAEEVSYEYDAQGRLTVAYYENGKMITYEYDAGGNRTITRTIVNGEVQEVSYDTDVDIVVLPLMGFYPMVYNFTKTAVTSNVDLDDFEATINYGTGTPVNLYDLAVLNGYNGTDHATITFNITSDITGSAGGGVAIQTGEWPDKAYLKLTLNIASGVKVYGGGGAGGAGGAAGANGSNGSSGGPAIVMNEGLIIVNSGIIKGGSGGGGGGAGYYEVYPMEGHPSAWRYGGGGGGGGWPNGVGASGGSGSSGNGAAGSNSNGTIGGAGGADGGGFAGNGGSGGHSSPSAGGNGGGGAEYSDESAYEVRTGGTGGQKGTGIDTNSHALDISGGGTVSSIE